MRYSKMTARVTGMLLIALGFLASCKKKNSQEGGLLDEPARISSASSGPSALTSVGPAVGGDWKITCVPVENPQDSRIYVIEISGAVSETDENQPVKISIHRLIKAPVAPTDSSVKEIASGQLGRGSVAKQGNIFFGFAGGALTGQYQSQTKKHDGLLTLVHDQDVAGLGVACDVTPTTPSLLDAGSPASVGGGKP